MEEREREKKKTESATVPRASRWFSRASIRIHSSKRKENFASSLCPSSMSLFSISSYLIRVALIMKKNRITIETSKQFSKGA